MLSSVLFDDLIRLMRELNTEPHFVQSLKDRIQMIRGDIRLHEEKVRGDGSRRRRRKRKKVEGLRSIS